PVLHEEAADMAAVAPGQPSVAAPPAASPVTAAESRQGVKKAQVAGGHAQGATAQLADSEFSTEAYDHVEETGFVGVNRAPLSTFSIDVDTASYANVRRHLQGESLPPAGAVRIEELINYFDYDYPAPRGDAPFSVYTEVAPAPWAPEHKLLHIGLQGRVIETKNLPPRNLVFLLDVSGSMSDANKLPLLKRSFSALLSTLGEKDRVAIAVYAGASGLVLPSTPANQKGRILEALEHLEAGGSTNGGEGIELAYRTAQESFQKGGVNRVILATDGDFNVGTTSESELVRLIEQKRDSGVFLTVLGYGMGNYKDSTLEKLADHGNGNYAYIDSYEEAQKVLVAEGGANLVTIAQDVKIQVEMNPRLVGAYRLIGYENRRLATEDFANDKKDAGEIGAGHSVTALYELLDPAQARVALKEESLRYQANAAPIGSDSELCNVKLRFKQPLGKESRLEQFPVLTPAQAVAPSANFRFSAAVASFGMLLRNSEYKGQATYAMVTGLADSARGNDSAGYRREFGELVHKAQRLSGQSAQIAR
ncbi:MAG TPA: VWA domain-containing protein, partial [Polyangiaceae bacterium]|nr:VWA domain-containing protein [Polyangiaceae bacterium]